MRNGLNITGVSESVHEYRDNPEEAIADYRVVTPLSASEEETVESRTLAMRNGTHRIARDFTLRHRLSLDGASGDPTPYESMLAAVAGCVLTTQVCGFSARGVSLGALRATARARLPLGPDGAAAGGAVLDGLGWRSEIDCDAPGEMLRSLNELVAAFSPNHQVALDSAPLEATVTVHGPGGVRTIPVEWTPEPQETAGSCAVEAHVVWEYGSESAYTTSIAPDGDTRHAGPLVVDQAKQMLGFDKGPNTQEILLAAVSAEVAGLLRRETAPAGVPLEGARLTGSGRLDTRGMLNVVREVPSRFHDIRLDLAVEGDPDRGPDVAEVLRAALSRAVLPATLLARLTVAVDVRRNGKEELSCLSTLAETEAVRDELTRRQRAAESA
jgi:hypothetical protein